MKILTLLKYLRLPVIIACVLLWMHFMPDFTSPPTDPADAVVMVYDELHFILKKEYQVEWITIQASTDTSCWMWAYGTNPYIDSSNYPKMRQIKYGQEIKGFRTQAPLQKLLKNTNYYAEIGTFGRTHKVLAYFYIADNNKVVMTRRFNPRPPKNPIVIVERNGKKITVPYSVSFTKDGNKVVTSGPVPAN